MKAKLLAGVFLLLYTAAVAAPPSTNEQFVTGSITRAAAAYLDSLQLTPAKVTIEPLVGLGGLAVDAVKAAFVAHGWTIAEGREGNQAGVKSWDLVLAISAFDFKYKSGKSRGFLRKRYIRREFSGQLLVDLSGPDYANVGFVDFSGSDEVLPQYKNYIKSLRFKELSPPVARSRLEKYVEPLAVSATVGGLIYLFFINR